MNLVDYIEKSFIFTEIQADSKEEAYEKIIENIVKKDKKLSDYKEEIKSAIFKREKEQTTVMEKGIAIPHARIKNFSDFIFSVSIMKNPLKSLSVSSKEENLKLIFMLVAPLVNNELMVRCMSGIAKLINKIPHEKFFDNCLKVENLYETIYNFGIQVGDYLAAKDIMNTGIKALSQEDNLEEVVKRMTLESVHYLPVLDKENNLLGEITEKEIIKAAMPKYLGMMDNLDFMTINEPFSEFFKNEQKVKVVNVYRTNAMTISEDTPVLQIAKLMMGKGVTRLYVVNENKYLGVIYRSYIIKKILHI